MVLSKHIPDKTETIILVKIKMFQVTLKLVYQTFLLTLYTGYNELESN